MFTGIVEEMGFIQSIEKQLTGSRFSIKARTVLEGTKIGDSICVNGCCLTVVKCGTSHWTCEAVPETLERTNLKYLKEGDSVNLERALCYNGRLGGHLIQGHVDETGQISDKQSLSDGSWWVTVEIPSHLSRYLVHKGSIAVEGVSLTIADLNQDRFSFAMIPHTANVTTLGLKKIGDSVNLEIDLIAKYVERFVAPFSSANEG